MKKIIAVIMCCLLLFLSACTTKHQTEYQRISLESDTLGEDLAEHISDDTEVVNTVDQVFPSHLPAYKITERNISEQECAEMRKQLGIPDRCSFFDFEGNTIHYSLVDYTDFSRGYFDMAEEDLEKLAWETFNKIPFMEGEYEYLGIKSTMTVNDQEGDHISRVGVSFRKLLNDTRVLGEERCTLEFDGSGLVGIYIKLFDYEEVGTMDLVPLESAAAKIKTPDAFVIDETKFTQELAVVEKLDVERIKILWINQHSEGCTILQPIYNFIGTATDTSGFQTEFSSRIIAVPESCTYEAK